MDYPGYVEPIKCRCGFSHVLGDTIQCTNPACSFWQHVVCYYEVDDFTVAPENHLCDQCRSADPQKPRENSEKDHEMLQSAEVAWASGPHAERPQVHVPYPEEPNRPEPRPNDAPVQSLETDEAHIPAVSSRPPNYDAFKDSLASFEWQSTAANIQWEPDSDEIQSCLKKISLKCFNISKSLLRDGFLLAEVPILNQLIQQMQISYCFAYSPNSNSESPTSRVTEKWLRAILVACAIDWIFYPGQRQTAQIARDESSSVSHLEAELNLILVHSFHMELANRCKYTRYTLLLYSRFILLTCCFFVFFRQFRGTPSFTLRNNPESGLRFT